LLAGCVFSTHALITCIDVEYCTLYTIVAILSFHVTPVFRDGKGGCDPCYLLGTDPIVPRAPYSLFNPTFPTVRRPQAPIPVASNISAKQVQNTALYPNKSASGEPFCTYEDSFVTLADMIAKSVRPMDVPNWAMVLKTAPASPWVSGEKTSVMIKFATVKITIRQAFISSLRRKLPSQTTSIQHGTEPVEILAKRCQLITISRERPQ
jgi:hypothetical protein